MNEWKELEIDNLPPDYFDDNDYIFEWLRENKNEDMWINHYSSDYDNHMSLEGKLFIIKEVKLNYCKYRYRKPEPKQPSHEEIMSKWWKYGGWHRIISFYPEDYKCYIMKTLTKTEVLEKEWFIGRESATIPPEAI